MNILIAFASKHGSTHEIADVIATTLTEDGLAVDVRAINDIDSVAGYHAVIIGSAVYFGRWQPSAIQFVRSHTDQLGVRPVWIFSSGPIAQGDIDQPLDVSQHMALSHAREHRLFGGCLDFTTLGMVEKLVSRGVHAESGDLRDWDEIRAWARGIGSALREPRTDQAQVA